MFKLLTGTCKKLDYVEISGSANDKSYFVDCKGVKKGNIIPGGKDLNWETGVYRFVRTDEALYQIHYVEHGKKSVKGKIKTQIREVGKSMVGGISICDLSDSNPCPPLDQYFMGETQFEEAKGKPPCQSDNTTPCNPSAIFRADAATSLNIDQSKKKSIIMIKIEELDITAMKTLNAYANGIINSLKQGSPGFLILFRAATRDSIIDTDTRIKVGSFINVIKGYLIAAKVISTNSINYSYMNFF